MPLIQYKAIDFSAAKLAQITRANVIIKEYERQGFSLTLRQLYYQFVSRDYISNNVKEYNRLGDLISDARLAGLIDWYSIVDRSRASNANQHWTRPSQILEGCVNTYAIDKWENQPNYLEVWVEKEALEDVLAQACKPMDVRFFACKGYTSQSAMWEASERLLAAKDMGKEVHIIHLGDHDPSGMDMTRDIFDRLELFTRGRVNVHRIALNMDQVEEYAPPPNPAKTTDSRFASYQESYGDESWELDALEPAMLVKLVQDTIQSYRNFDLWEDAVKLEERGKLTLESICTYFPDVVGFLRDRRRQDRSRVVCEGCGATEANPKCRCDGGRGLQLGEAK